MTSGSASAALVGLLFVALSIRVDEIRSNRIALARASATFRGLVTSLLISLALLVPGYSRVSSAVVVAAGASIFVIQARLIPTALLAPARKGSANPAMFVRAGAFQVMSLAIVVAGIALFVSDRLALAYLVLAAACGSLIFLALLNSYALVSRTEEQMETDAAL